MFISIARSFASFRLHAKVQAVLSHYLTQESLGVAFQDCFVVFAVVYVAAALASMCIPGGEVEKS